MKVKRTKESLEDLEKSGKKSRDALSAKNRELALLLHENLTEARTVEIVRSKVAEKGAVKEELIHINDQVCYLDVLEWICGEERYAIRATHSRCLGDMTALDF